MRLCLDENVPDHLKTRLEARGHNVALSREVAGRGVPDKELLKVCREERRVLLTNDSDFDRLHETRYHEGILRYSVNRPMDEEWGEIVTGIGMIDEHVDMKNELQWPAEWAKTLEQ